MAASGADGLPMAEVVERRRFPRPPADGDPGGRWAVGARSTLDQSIGRTTLARFGALALCWLLVIGDGFGGRASIGLAVVAVWTLLRWQWPVRDDEAARLGLHLTADVAVATAAVALTGSWSSPLTPALLPAVLVVGLAERGLLPATVAMVSAGIVTAAWTLESSLGPDQLMAAAQGTFVLLIVTGVTNFAARSVTSVQQANAAQAASLTKLRGANTLLQRLHELALELPASLDLRDVIDRTVANTRNLTGADVVAILLAERDLPGWSVAGADGAYLPTFVSVPDIPAHLAATTSGKRIGVSDGPTGQSLSGIARVSVGIHLRARDRDLGILVLEWLPASSVDLAQVTAMAAQIVEPVALAIDNARWFRAIERTAADEERLRIARDLHDRLGQSVALVGFELDGLRRTVEQSAAPQLVQELDAVRGHVRGIVTELRETLYDLRTEVTTDRDLVATVSEFLERVEQRSHLEIRFDHDVRFELSARQERELWLITQEAIRNAERHASATQLDVRYRVRDNEILVEVADNGRGIDAGAGRPDSFGLRGLRERAATLGARIEITTNNGQGTVVRCRVPRR